MLNQHTYFSEPYAEGLSLVLAAAFCLSLERLDELVRRYFVHEKHESLIHEYQDRHMQTADCRCSCIEAACHPKQGKVPEIGETAVLIAQL